MSTFSGSFRLRPPLGSDMPALGGQQLADLDAAEQIPPALLEPAERFVSHSDERLPGRVGFRLRLLDLSKEIDLPLERLEDVREREPLRLHAKEVPSVRSPSRSQDPAATQAPQDLREKIAGDAAPSRDLLTEAQLPLGLRRQVQDGRQSVLTLFADPQVLLLPCPPVRARILYRITQERGKDKFTRWSINR